MGYGLARVAPQSRAAAASPGGGWRFWFDRLPPAGVAILGYLAVRVVGLLILWLFSDYAGLDFWRPLIGRYDSTWYAGIAERGYDAAIPVNPDGSYAKTNLAFFPLYPALVALVAAATPLPTGVAGLVVSWLAGLAAAWGIYRVGCELRSHLTGVVLAVLWGVVPPAIVQNMAYSETLFAALVAWCLLAVLRRRWLGAGGLCLLAGLTRPTAIALIAAVSIPALVAIARRSDGWRPWLALGLAPLGYLGYLAWVAARLDRIDAYFFLQRASWSIRFDGGYFTVRSAGQLLTRSSMLAQYTVTLMIGLAVVLLLLSLLDRLPLPVLVFSATTVVFVIGAAGSYHGKGRYLMPAFTLLVPVAFALAAARARTRVVVVTFLALASAYYSTYVCLYWPFSP